MRDFLQFLVAGVAVGSLYALLALGFVIVYKATGVINFAHGGLLLLGTYLTYDFKEKPASPSTWPSWWPWPSAPRWA